MKWNDCNLRKGGRIVFTEIKFVNIVIGIPSGDVIHRPIRDIKNNIVKEALKVRFQPRICICVHYELLHDINETNADIDNHIDE